MAELVIRFGVNKSTINRVGRDETFKDFGSDSDLIFIAGSDQMRPEAMDGSQLVTSPMRTYEDITGRTFERLTVVSFESKNDHGETKWNCVCACGKTKMAFASCLRNGRVRSCGCLIDESRKRKR